MIKKLPKNIAVFRDMIENNYIYVDKTKEVYTLLQEETKCFLSRPRRFGKSLLVDTLKELFEGNKKLFKGLYIEDKWDWDKKYPVLHLDMAELYSKTPEKFENSLNHMINRIAKKESIELLDGSSKDKFGELIEELNFKYNEKLVVLIDEYDFPIINNMENIKVAEENRTTLSEFYQILKSKEKYIQFLFLTGVSKFSKTTIFSKLNNLTDLTIDPRYATICGYTQNELNSYFKEYIFELADKKGDSHDETLNNIKNCYDGYSWDGENFLYNPDSILKTLDQKKYGNFWFESGTPSFLLDLIKKDNVDISSFLSLDASFDGEFPTFQLDNIDLKTVLLQTGYLTIKKHIETTYDEYILDIPNNEVKKSLFSYLIGMYTSNMPGEIGPLAKKFLNALIMHNNEKTSQILDMLLGKIPYQVQMKNWKYYHSIFPTWFYMMGLETVAEESNSQGQIDAVLKYKNLDIITKIKYSQTKSIKTMLNEANKQIYDKRYYQTYQDKNPIILAIAIQDAENAKEIQCQIHTLKELKEK
ncbi:MAG: ATP-binding protein, partial [Methanobrevibacter sp.]|nr:ATP-binding protein [Candidatus Methanoflexus mossambicus]